MRRFVVNQRCMFVRTFSTDNKVGKVGFIGLGNMGKHMATNLIKAGNNLVVFDISRDAMNELCNRGALGGSSPSSVAQQCDVVVTMLPSSPHVKSVYQGTDGILKSVKPGALLIDSSTIDPTTARQVHQDAKLHKAEMIDAPVSGGVGGAMAGTLTFMVGSSEAAFQRAKPLLQQMGKNIVHCGPSGNGQVAKIANNLVLAISMIGVSEGMNLGIQLGMDPKKLTSIFNTSSARCWSSDTYNPCPGVMENVPSSRGYTGGFGIDLMKKDLGLAVQAAQDAGIVLPLGSSSLELYERMSKQSHGNKDFSFVFQFLQSLKDNHPRS